MQSCCCLQEATLLSGTLGVSENKNFCLLWSWRVFLKASWETRQKSYKSMFDEKGGCSFVTSPRNNDYCPFFFAVRKDMFPQDVKSSWLNNVPGLPPFQAKLCCSSWLSQQHLQYMTAPSILTPKKEESNNSTKGAYCSVKDCFYTLCRIRYQTEVTDDCK